MAPRLRTRLEPNGPLIVAALIALALLALGEAASGAFRVAVTIEGHGPALQVSVDGLTHQVVSVVGGPWQRVVLEQPGPVEREYQIDGSDTTATDDRQPQLIRDLVASPLYQLDAWLRDEGSYSRWEHLSVVDLATGSAVSPEAELPADFRLRVDLRRPEARATVWLVGSSPDRREGLELERDRRNARWMIQRGGAIDALPRWFFPEQPAPFAAELVQQVGRAAAAGYALALASLALGWAISRLRFRVNLPFTPFVPDAVLAAWLVAAALVATRVFHQLPHILDSVSYTFQAGLFASGQLSLPPPPLTEAFKGPFQVLWQDRIFSQYPPGAPAMYGIGNLVGLEWLVGPLACLVLIAATSWTARTLFGTFAGLTVLALGVLSPFVLFQSGSFLSHPVAGGLLAGALATFVTAEQGTSRGQLRWYAATGVLLGAGLVTREVGSVLFALPIGARLITCRRWKALLVITAFGAPFVVAYLLYNLAQTGNPFLLPRALFDPADHFGFGDGIGFHTRHTLAAGLANTDELLTSLQLDLFGWPPVFTLGLIGLPFLFKRARVWDRLAAFGFLAFVVAYVDYFYHGIALGPRYYFEAVPWLLLLGARGVETLASLAKGRAAAAAVVALLSLNTVMFYTPAELQRRADLSGMPGGVRINLGFVQSTLFGPRLNVPSPSLVLSDDWWVFNTALAPLNCPRLPDCGVSFALATNPADAERLHAAYPDRTLLRAVNNAGRIDVVPY